MKKSNNIPKFLLEAKICNDNNCELRKRINKAIEYVENNILYTEDYDYDEEDNLVWKGAYDYEAREDLLNILRGNDK